MTDIVVRLLLAGTDPALVAEVAMELGRLNGLVEAASKPDQMAENRRAWDRERRRNERAEAKALAMSTGRPPESADKADNGSPDKEKSPTPPKEINPSGDGRKARAQGGTRLPDDWKQDRFAPDTVAREVIDRRGQDWGKRALESFRNHWRSANGPNAKKRDWQAAWANWVIEQDNRDGQRNGKLAGSGPQRSGASRDGFGAAIREMGGYSDAYHH